MTITELCVHMCCTGCEQKVRKYLAKLDGIDSVDVDMAMQKVTVAGYVDQKKVLKAVRKTGRRAVLWPYPYTPDQCYPADQSSGRYQATTFTANPFAYSTASSSSYNYRKHGYDESVVTHGYYQMPAGSGIVGDGAGAMFSDDNPNACFIM